MMDFIVSPTGQVDFFDCTTGKTIKRVKLQPGESWSKAWERVNRPKPFASLRRIGGLIHWRIGRLGGSFYWSKG